MCARRPHGGWARLLLGLVAVFALFQWSAAALGSVRGEAGLVVGALVVVALFAVEGWLFGERPAAAARLLGFGRPARSGMLTAVAISAAMLLVIPAYLVATSSSWSTWPRWVSLLPGLFAQAGIAEEALFRGYLFRRVREGRAFWRAAVLAAIPFVVVHLLMFVSLPWPVALASLALAAVISFPLARLFELGGGTIWAPALVHFVIQGALKVVVVADERSQAMAMTWLAASALLPWLAFLVPQERT